MLKVIKASELAKGQPRLYFYTRRSAREFIKHHTFFGNDYGHTDTFPLKWAVVERANTNIPEEEMLLAETIAYCNDKGITGCWGTMFIFTDGTRSILNYGVNAEKVSSCCAAGALSLIGNYGKLDCDLVIAGNDTLVGCNDSYDSNSPSFDFGNAFSQAMNAHAAK